MLTMICLTTSVGALRLCSVRQYVSNALWQQPRSLLYQTFVDSHLVAIPGLGTLTTRGFAGSDLQDLSGKADGTLDAEVLGFGTLDEVGGDCEILAPGFGMLGR
jgi:hypothetical protein